MNHAMPLSNQRPETGAFFARDRGMHPPAYTPSYKTSILRSPQKAMISLNNTLSEITGPVFGHNILGPLDNDLMLNFAAPGERRSVRRYLSMAGCSTNAGGWANSAPI